MVMKLHKGTDLEQRLAELIAFRTLAIHALTAYH